MIVPENGAQATNNDPDAYRDIFQVYHVLEDVLCQILYLPMLT